MVCQMVWLQIISMGSLFLDRILGFTPLDTPFSKGLFMQWAERELEGERRVHTRKEALYAIPIGRFATIARALFAFALLNARLWEISWIAKNKFWFAVAPTIYAVKKNFHDRNGVFWRRYAQRI